MNHKATARVVAVVTVIALILAGIFLIKWGTGEKTETTKDWVHYFNLDLQDDDDDDPENDFNFGPNPYAEEKTAEEYKAEFIERLKVDPALAAAAMSWTDATTKTRFLGEFFEMYEGNWATTMNVAKVAFASNQEYFYKTLDVYFAFLEKAEAVEIRECKKISDQMYMNPVTMDGVPDIIVMETKDHDGIELVFVFKIKGEKVEVAFRVNCGFQPTNVAKTMAITPTKQPTQDPEPTKPTPTKPDPTPTQPSNPKDPDKAPKENTEPNDDPGPGPDTNNPKDPTKSTEDKPTNSNHYDSYDDYKKDMEDLKKTNSEQKKGGDSNKPSTETPTAPKTNVDNNGYKGTGNGGIDTPTPVKPPATVAEDDKPIDDSPGEAWGGPPD